MNAMKKTRFFCIILSVVIIFSASAPTYASAADSTCDCGYLPTIYVGPLGNTPIIQNAGEENEKQLFRISDETTTQLITALVPALLKLAFTRNYDKFGDTLISTLKDAFGALALDGNGNSAPDVTTNIELPTDPAHGMNKDYYFHYDWRLDPVEVAAQLNSFVQHIKTLTGHSKVHFRASSMGGVVTMAYFDRFGYDDVDACVFQCCPILGTAVAGDLLSQKLKLDGAALYRYGTQAYPPVDAGSTALTVLFDVIYYGGLVGAVMKLGDKILDKLGDRLFDELLIPVFGTMLGLWSFVPDATYEQAKARSLTPETQSGLIAKADYYHYNVQGRAKEILTAAQDAGVRVMIVAGSGMQRTPLVESMNNDSDATVDTMYASAGATVAELDSVLPQGYTQKVTDGHNHISPDMKIDASTCALPEHTWFINGMLHSNSHDGIRAMYNWFTFADEYYDVYSNPNYTQFLQNDKPNLRVIALGNFAPGAEKPVYDEGNSYYDKFQKYVEPVRGTVKGVLDKIV